VTQDRDPRAFDWIRLLVEFPFWVIIVLCLIEALG